MYIIGITILLTILTLFNIWYCNQELFNQKENWKNKITKLIKRKNVKGLLTFGIVIGMLLFLVHYQVYQYKLFHSVKMICTYEWLLPVAYIDYKKKIIPNRWILAGLGMFSIFAFFEIGIIGLSATSMMIYYFTGFLLGFGVFLFCLLFTKNGIGMGDLKLFSLLGVLLGWEGIFNVLFLSVLGMTIYGVVMLIAKKKDKHSLIPMGPFAFLAMMCAILLGI